MSKQFPHPFADMEQRFKTLVRQLPAIASQVAMKEFDLNFKDQGLRVSETEVQKWKERQRPDRTRAGRSKARRHILVKSGELRRSFRAAPTADTAIVQNTAPYAAIHNRGGRIRGEMRAYATNLRSGLTRLRRSGNPAMMPARPFMVTTPLLLDKIGKAVHTEVEALFANSKSA